MAAVLRYCIPFLLVHKTPQFHIIKLFEGLIHLFQKALGEIVGVCMGGFTTLEVVLQGFRDENGKTLMTTRRISSLALKNVRDRSPKRLLLRVSVELAERSDSYIVH